MTAACQISKGAYFDLLTLMRIAMDFGPLVGEADAALVMGTRSHQAILRTDGLFGSQFK
jgi:hypothetical protein